MYHDLSIPNAGSNALLPGDRESNPHENTAGMGSSESNTQPYYLNTFVDAEFSEFMQVEEPKEPEPWCRLVSRSAATPQFELKYIDNVEKRTMTVSSDSTIEPGNSSTLDITGSSSGDENTNKRLHVHTIGRSAHCFVKFENYSRISNRHCSIFCKQNFSDPLRPYLEAWIEDTSANGTMINKERLKKNVPRLLHNGDELHLINPDLARVPNSGVSAEDIAKHSFTITLNLPTPHDTIGQDTAKDTSVFNISAMQNVHIGSSNSSSVNDTSNMLARNSTVHRLLNQNRNINDYYVLKELLGSGAAGLVYRSISKETGRDWAVKVVDTRQLVIASSTSQEITKEAELLRSLRHPNIIHLEDIFSSGNNIYLVMELSVGGDLFDRITKKKAYPEHEAKEVTRQILHAMVYMHENKVAHRDLKPENILLARKDSDVDIKITDFGLAKKLDDQGGLKSYCGTPQYYAPEVLQRQSTVLGLGTYSLAADMWSIGVILYVLLSGSYPFSDSDRDRKIATASFSFQNAKVWKSVSVEAKNLIKQLLVVNPDMRLTAKQALQNVWFTGTALGMMDLSTSSASSSSSSSSTTAAAAVSSSEQMQVSESQPPPPPSAKGGRKANGGAAKTRAAANAKPSNSPTSAVVAPSTGRSTRSSSRKGNNGKINDTEAMPPPKGRPSPAKQKKTGALDKWLSPGPVEAPEDVVDRQQVVSTTIGTLPADKLSSNPIEVLGQQKRTRSSKAQQDSVVVRVKRAKPQPPQEDQLGAASTCGANQPNPLEGHFAMNSSLL